MDKEVVWFIRLSIVYFMVGCLLGVAFAFRPEMADSNHIALHTHLNLLGWMSMMIFGVGYHILPKFSGKLIYSRKMQTAQFWTANIGLIGMAAGWGMLAHDAGPGRMLLGLSSLVMTASILLFALNMMLTIKGPDPD